MKRKARNHWLSVLGGTVVPGLRPPRTPPTMPPGASTSAPSKRQWRISSRANRRERSRRRGVMGIIDRIFKKAKIDEPVKSTVIPGDEINYSRDDGAFHWLIYL